MNARTLLRECLTAASDVQAQDPTVIDLRHLVDYTDYFLVVSGGSDRQVKAIADRIVERLARLGVEPQGLEGHETGQWILLDYGDVVVHVFYEETRRYYALEGLWHEAPRVALAV